MPPDSFSYQAYLLRLWRAAPDTAWRASLEAVGSRTTHYFVSPEDLLAYLYTKLDFPANVALQKGEDDAEKE